MDEPDFWDFQHLGENGLEFLYFPELLALSKLPEEAGSMTDDQIIFVASPRFKEKRLVGFLNGGVSIIEDSKFQGLLADQQKKVTGRNVEQ